MDHQTFLTDLNKKLWNVVDRLRSNLSAAVYMHMVIRFILAPLGTEHTIAASECTFAAR